MKVMVALRLSKETAERLQLLADKTGRTKTYYAQEAIEKHIKDLERKYMGEKASRPALVAPVVKAAATRKAPAKPVASKTKKAAPAASKAKKLVKPASKK